MYLVKNSKSPNYQIVYENDGKLTTKSTGQKTKKEAERFLEIFKKQLLAKVAPNNLVSTYQTKNKITLRNFQREYETNLSNIKSKKYISSITSSFDHLIRFTGNINLSEVSIKLLDQFFTNTYSRTEKDAHHYYRTLRAAFNKAVAWEYLETSPFKKVKLPQPIKTKPVFISMEEFLIIRSFVPVSILSD